MNRPEADLVSGEELARWLGVSGKEIYDLGKVGILVRVGRAYRLEESVRRYCQHLRRGQAKANAEPASHPRPLANESNKPMASSLVGRFAPEPEPDRTA
jgi:hypothetical protein